MGRQIVVKTLILLSAVAFGESKCMWSQWDAVCPQGTQEVYREGNYARSSYSRLCCSEQDEIRRNMMQAKECRNTICMPLGTKNPCNPGTPYFEDRVTIRSERLLGYIPVRNASCTINGRTKGVGYSCCLPSEDGTYLSTALGTEYREFPHQVDLHGCGGTVYNKRWIITAAHCVVESDGTVTSREKLRLTLGSDVSGVAEDNRKYQIEQVRVYEKYSMLRNHSNFRRQRNYFNDIALVKVNRDIVFDDSVRPLRIATQGSEPDEFDNRLVIVGWGKTDTGFGSSFLQKGETPIRTYEQCYGTRRVPSILDRQRRQTYQMSREEFLRLFSRGNVRIVNGSNNSAVAAANEEEDYEESMENNESNTEEVAVSGRTESNDGGRRQTPNGSRPWAPWSQNAGFSDGVICIGGVVNGTFGTLSFSGDSGGPAICRSKNGQAVLCGVSSSGSTNRENCAKSPTKENCPPSFYTKVSKYSNWIKGVAGEQMEADLYKPYLFGRDTRKTEYAHQQIHITSMDNRRGGNRDMKCGGTLVNKNKIVTAAQCVVNARKKQHQGLKVTAKIHDIKDRGEVYKISKIEVHEKFKKVKLPFRNQVTADFNRSAMEQEVFINDIAIITLDRDVSGVKRFPKIPPASSEPFSGMGVELSRRYDPRYSSVIQSRDYKLLSQSECQERLGRMTAVGVRLKTDASIICSVEKYSGASSCDRELGGGVICKDQRRREVLCGVQVLRLCTMAFPNGFLNPGHYSSWINERI